LAAHGKQQICSWSCTRVIWQSTTKPL
jgi:hypothetical protein